MAASQRNLDLLDRAIAQLLAGSDGLAEHAELSAAAIRAASQLREAVAQDVHGEHDASVTTTDIPLDLAGGIKPTGEKS
jgi:hypothetical protein